MFRKKNILSPSEISSDPNTVEAVYAANSCLEFLAGIPYNNNNDMQHKAAWT